MWQAWIFLILTVILWGTAPIIEKTGLKGADEFTAVFIRSTAIFLIIFVAFGLSGKFSSLAKIPLKTIAIISAGGICAGLLGVWTYFKVLKVTPASKIVPLAATYPLVTAILSVLILKEEFSWLRLVGTVLIVLGIFLVK